MWKRLLGSFQSLSWPQWFLSVPPCCCSTSERINEQMATAFPLIVISLSQGELSRDRAHKEQFSSPPIQTAAVFAEAEQLNRRRTTKERLTDWQTDRQHDEYGQKSKHRLCTHIKILNSLQHIYVLIFEHSLMLVYTHHCTSLPMVN